MTAPQITFAPLPWDGSVVDARGVTSVRVWVTTAAATGYTYEVSPDGGNWVALAPLLTITPSGLVYDTTAVNAVGVYDYVGESFIRLTGGTGGLIFVAGNSAVSY